MPRRRACGSRPRAPTIRCSPRRCGSTCRASSRASPGRSGRRTRSSSPRSTRSSGSISPRNMAIPKRAARRGSRRRAQCRRHQHDIGHGDVVIAAITSLHQHLQPLGAGRRRPGRAQGAGLGARFQALGEDQPRAGIAGRDRLSRPRRALARISTRSASTWSAMAAPPASAIRGRCPRRSAPRSTRTTSSPPRSSPATAISKAACRPTCAPIISPRRRSSSPMRSRARSSRTWSTTPIGQDERRQRRLSQGHLAVERRDPLADRPVRQRRHVPRPLCRRLQGRRALAGDRGHRRRHLWLAGRHRPTSPTRPISRA